MEKFTTDRGKSGIIHDGFQFRLFRNTKTYKLWRCVKKSCKASCKTDLDELMILENRSEHNHEEPSERQVQRQIIRQICKRKAEDEPGERPSKIILNEIGKQNAQDLLPNDVQTIRLAVYRQRRKTQPKLPQSREETIQSLSDFELISSQQENMIMKSDENTNIVMFSTESNLRFLNQEIDLFGDGTFQFCPKFFFQLYTILGFKNGQYVPCVFFLLPGKGRDCYESMFRILKESCSNIDINLNIELLHLDFEPAVYDAARTVWPNVIIKACQFHLGQSWFRKIQSLGLTNTYKDSESEVGKWLKSFFGLSYFDPCDIEEVFAFDILSQAPADDENAMLFADYILNTYVDRNARFPSILWADSNLCGKRTTNGCESFHKQLSMMFYQSHPNIFDFMEKLKTIQTNNYLKMRASQNVLYEKQDKEKLRHMKSYKEEYERGEISRLQYLRKMAYKSLPPAI